MILGKVANLVVLRQGFILGIPAQNKGVLRVLSDPSCFSTCTPSSAHFPSKPDTLQNEERDTEMTAKCCHLRAAYWSMIRHISVTMI